MSDALTTASDNLTAAMAAYQVGDPSKILDALVKAANPGGLSRSQILDQVITALTVAVETEKILDQVGMFLWPDSDACTSFLPGDIAMTLWEMEGDRRGSNNVVAADYFGRIANLVHTASEPGDLDARRTAAREALNLMRNPPRG